MDEKDLFWLAGLLEGEGSFLKPAPSEPGYSRVKISMTDYDIILRVTALFKVRYICASQPYQENHKCKYITQVKGRNAVTIMRQLYPLMGERRKMQIAGAVGEIPQADYEYNEENWFYWLAGLLEGEGSFLKSSPSRLDEPRVHVNMTDQDVMERVALLMQVKSKGPYRRTEGDTIRKPRYFATSKGPKAMRLMEQLRPHMGQRRQAQIDAALASYQVKGHPQGDTHPQAKLTAEKVSIIKRRLRAGEKLTRLAAEYEVDRGLIWQIKAGRIWRQVE
jgi:hypothetical protein